MLLLHTNAFLTNQLQTATEKFGSEAPQGIELVTAEFLFIFIETGTEFDLSFYFTCNLLRVDFQPRTCTDRWKLQIQGINIIRIDQQCLKFASSHSSVPEINSLSCNCISQHRSAQDLGIGDFLKAFLSWQAILQLDICNSGKILNPKVLTEIGNLQSGLSSKAINDFRNLAIQSNLYYLPYDKWILAFPSQTFQGESHRFKEVCNLCIQIVRDFQQDKSEVNFYSCLAKNNPVHFCNHFSGRYLPVRPLIIDHTELHHGGKKMQLNLGQNNTTTVAKAAGGSLARHLSNAEATSAVSKQGSDQDYYIPCSKKIQRKVLCLCTGG